jgi:hypothetical protein
MSPTSKYSSDTSSDRADQISSELALHTYQVDEETLLISKEIAALSRAINQLTLEVHDHIKNS